MPRGSNPSLLLEKKKLVISLSQSTHLQDHQSILLKKKNCSLTSTIVCRAAFGTKCKDEDEFTLLARESAALAGGFDIADLFPSKKFLHVVSGLKFKLEKIHGKVDKILDNIINDHRENPMSAETSKGELWKEELHLHMQGRRYSFHAVDPGPTEDRNVWGEGIHHNEVYHYLFSISINGQGDLSLRSHHSTIKSY